MRKAYQNVISEEQRELAQLAKALGHPVRIFIVNLLASQTCCYSGDLSEILPIAKSTLSQHLKELKKAGIIQGEIYPPRIKYCLNPDTWQKAGILFHQLFEKKPNISP